MEVAPIIDDLKNDLKKFFTMSDRLEEGIGPKSDPTYYIDAKLQAENRLRRLVGAPEVARKSKTYN